MDITNCRSMELLKRLGIDTGLREVGRIFPIANPGTSFERVRQNFSFDVNFSTGLSEKGQSLARWDLPSPDAWRARIKQQNDGGMPREPYQRCSQAIFEAWLKPKIQEVPLIETHFGWKLESLVESSTSVEAIIIDETEQLHKIKSQYVIGCDGAGSKVRAAIGSKLEGGPVPGAMHLIHFKSRDLNQLHSQGQFWHIFFTSGAIIISQDEVNTWTVHIPVPIGTDITTIEPKQAIYKALGGENEPLEIEIDEILVTSVWRPNIYLADKYGSESRRVFISGDAAHQNIPTGGYGMNTAVGDSFDIGWKLAAVLAGHGGQDLLDSYEVERRPVGARNIERSGVHWESVHGQYWAWCRASPGLSSADTEDGHKFRTSIAELVKAHDGENKDHGIELGYRYSGSPVVVGEDAAREPAWSFRDYVPSTWPGARAPHVFLADGKTSVYDLFGSGNLYTLVDFTHYGRYAKAFEEAAEISAVPLKTVHIPQESHVRKIWERDAVLVRPDDHVAWRSPQDSKGPTKVQASEVLSVATGSRETKDSWSSASDSIYVSNHQSPLALAGHRFTGTVGGQTHAEVQDLAPFQR